MNQPAEIEALINTAIEKTGSIDVLISNAGVIDPIARLADSDPEAWGQIVDVNFKGVYHGRPITDIRYRIAMLRCALSFRTLALIGKSDRL